MYDYRYAHFSKGDIVRLKLGTRIAPYNQDLHDAGTGVVTDITNAGFRGLEYGIKVDSARRCHGVSAADLELVTAVAGGPIPWPRQGTYLDGPNGETIRVGA